MSIAKLVKVLTEATEPFQLTTKKLSGLMKSSTPEEVQRVEALIKSRYNTFKEGDVTVFTPHSSIRAEAQVTNIQKEAIAGKTGINLGNVPDPQSKIGADLNTSSYVSNVIIPEVLRNELPKLNNTERVLSTSIRDDHWTTFHDLVSFKDKKLGRIDQGLTSVPSKSMGDFSKELVERTTLNKYQENRLNQVYGKIVEDIEKGLSKEELDNFNFLVDLHSESEVDEIPTNLGFIVNGVEHPANKKVQDAVLSRRALLTHDWEIRNRNVVRQAKKDGAMLLDDSSIVKPAKQTEVKLKKPGEKIKTKKGYVVEEDEIGLGEAVGDTIWTKEKKDAGYKLWRLEKNGRTSYTVLSPEDIASRLKDIPDDYKIIAYRPGYSPVKYTQPWAITKLGLDEEGRVIASRIATSRSRRAAEQAIDRVAGKEANVAYFAHRSFEDGMDVAMDNSLPNLIDNFSSQELGDLEKVLTGLGFAEVDVNRLMKFRNFFSHKRQSSMMRRGQRLINADTLGTEKPEYAAIMPNNQALASHMQATSSYLAYAEHFKMLEDAFMEEFGHMLPKGARWSDAVNIFQKTKQGRSAREAYIVQAQLKRVEGRVSNFDELLDRYVTESADYLLSKPVGRDIEALVDKISKHFNFDLDIPTVSQTVGNIKLFGGVSKLGLVNVSQLPMQATAMLNILGYSGQHALVAGSNLVSIFMAPRLGLDLTENAKYLKKLLDDSGFIADLDFVTIANNAKGKYKLANSRLLRKLYDKNLMFYQMGEGSVRAAAWLAEHHKMVSKILKGRSVFSINDIGSRAYLDDISSRAMKPALNMSRMNQPLIARGLLGMPLQFQQFVVQQANFMFGGMSNLQRFGIFGAWVGAFGVEGIPFMMDALNLSETLASQVAGPQAYGWWQRTVDDIAGKAGELFEDTLFDFVDKQFVRDYFYGGLLPAVTDGQISFAHRAGMAKYLSEFFGNAPLDDTLFGPAYQVAATILTNTVDNMKDLWNIINSEEKFSTNWVLNAASKQVEGLSGPSNILEAIEAANRGELRDKKLNLITDEPTLSEVMLLGTGFGIQEQQRRYERIFSAKERLRKLTNWMRKKSIDIGEDSVDKPSLSLSKFQEGMLQVHQYNPALVPFFQSMVTRERTARLAPADQRELQSNFLNYSRAFSAQETEAMLEIMEREYGR